MAGALTALPPLREDLALLPGPRTADGAPSWTLHDPAANRFLRVGWLEFEILQRWDLGRADRVAEAISRETPIHAEPADVLEFQRFAEAAELVQAADPAASRRMAGRVEARRLGPAKWLLKNYLFIRIPLIRPDALLDRLMPVAGRLFGAGFLWLTVAAALLGLYLIGRQWDAFVHTVPRLFSLEGALFGSGALVFAKIVHELGHGFAAKRAGCRVPAMGLAFMVLMPVLWTDTTDAWRLTDRRRRLLIDAGGMMAELVLAAWASLAWGLLPDGPLRGAMFILAGTTWVLTLAVNLNPLMRFDGYFLLSDALDVPNLQDRSFALARWWLREALFGLGEPPPERLPAGRRRFLIAYALAVWVYRFLLFLGIALLVYHLFFKLLGLFLMAVEIGWFILRPIAQELGAWAARRGRMRWNRRSAATLAALALAVGAAFVPWRSEVSAPAVLHAERQSRLYAIHPGRIAAMPAGLGAAVAEGDPVFVLDSPDLAHRIAQVRRQIQSIQAQAAAQSVDPEQAARLPVTWQELEGATADLAALEAQRAAMTVTAPFAGRIAELPEHLAPGAWVAAREPLGLLLAPGAAVAEAFVPEAELGRVALGDAARFLPDGGGEPVPLTLRSIDAGATRELKLPELASAHGGTVAARADRQGRLIPEESVYRALLAPAAPVPEGRARRGTVVIAGERASWAARVWRHAVGVLIRESGW